MGKRKTPLVKKHGAMVLAIAKSPTPLRKKLIRDVPDQVIQCISECCSNVLKGNVKLTSAQMQRLRSKRQQLRTLADKSVTIPKKKKVLNQTGGFLPFIVPLLGKAIVGGALSALAR